MTVPGKPLLTPEQVLADLMLLLDLEPRGGDIFVGRRREDGTGRVFGGQAIAQALGAATRTVEAGRLVHSLHAYFLRPGSDALPIEYRVKRDLDGRSFSNRRVVASQNGKPILNLVASFQDPVDGPGHQYPTMPQVPPPEALESDQIAALRRADEIPDGPIKTLILRQQPVEFRSVQPRNWLIPEQRPPHSDVWFRTVAPLSADQSIQQIVLAWISDFQLLGTAVQPNVVPGVELKVASLDHAM
ncbi:MAG: thioesterase family protein, partial [Erythrobacter sp.]|nr:thioesterase family protein [Erythrobacter sp.]